MLADAGIQLGNQTVLLRGVNDDPEVMKTLMRKLLSCRVRPYYIYQADMVAGTEHFRTRVEKGLEIIQEGLRGWTSGLAVPHFVIDSPGGGGKIPLLPQYVESMDDRQVVLRNYEGKRFVYRQVPDAPPGQPDAAPIRPLAIPAPKPARKAPEVAPCLTAAARADARQS